MVLYIGCLIFLSLVSWGIAHGLASEEPSFLRKHYIAVVGVGVGLGLIPLANIIISVLVLVLIAWFLIETQLVGGKWLNAPANKKHRE